eukprot:9498268-Pyramimonas_sp.AAC.1
MTDIDDKVIHPSHHVAVAHGQFWRWRCALVASHTSDGRGRPTLLANECRDRVTPSGETVLKRLRIGLPPKAGQCWPDGTWPPNGRKMPKVRRAADGHRSAVRG